MVTCQKCGKEKSEETKTGIEEYIRQYCLCNFLQLNIEDASLFPIDECPTLWNVWINRWNFTMEEKENKYLKEKKFKRVLEHLLSIEDLESNLSKFERKEKMRDALQNSINERSSLGIETINPEEIEKYFQTEDIEFTRIFSRSLIGS